jgi:hypothetical protein
VSDPLKNLLRSASDPLKRGPNAGRVLAGRFGETANGFDRDAVRDATVSVLLDLVRQTNGDRAAAHAKLSEYAEKMHELLDKHYDHVTGKRRHVFAFDQQINVVFTDDRKRN